MISIDNPLDYSAYIWGIASYEGLQNSSYLFLLNTTEGLQKAGADPIQSKLSSQPVRLKRKSTANWNHQGPFINPGCRQTNYITVPGRGPGITVSEAPQVAAVCTWGCELSQAAIRLCLELHINGTPSQGLQTLIRKQLLSMTVHIFSVLVSPEIEKN